MISPNHQHLRMRERRSALAELHVRLLVGLAEVYERRGACNEAADRLREAILNGELSLGQRLREEELSERLHVSRAPVPLTGDATTRPWYWPQSPARPPKDT